MSTIKTTVTSVITLELTDGEAGASAAICGYSPEIFLKWFEERCGKSYIAPYKDHMRSLFEKARTLDREVKKVEKKRSEIQGTITI